MHGKRKICVITGTRAEYGLLRGLMERIRASEEARLQILVTGMHLSPEFGLTYKEIEGDSFAIDSKVEMLLSSDTPAGIAKSMGLAMSGVADAMSNLQPDLVVVLGDRFEIFAAAAAATVARIPIAHIHGGELTEGAFDEAFRHSITKMSHLHFTSTEVYRRRVIQLGVGNCNQGSQMEDDIHPLADMFAKMRIPYITGDHLNITETGQLLQPSPVVERVVLRKGPNPVAPGHKQLGQMGADKAVSSGYQCVTRHRMTS